MTHSGSRYVDTLPTRVALGLSHAKFPLIPLAQYWVTYAFLTVFESAVNAVYWFRMSSFCLTLPLRTPSPSTLPPKWTL